MARAAALHRAPRPLPLPATKAATSAGSARGSSWIGWMSSIRRDRRRGPHRVGRRHVASPRVAWAAMVRSSTRRSAVARSSPSMVSGPGGRRRRHRDVGQSEELLERPALAVDGLDARDRRDARLLVQPAGPRVDRLRSDLPAVHVVAPLRHDDQVREADERRAGQRRGLQAAVSVVEYQPGDQGRDDDQPADQRAHPPVADGGVADAMARWAKRDGVRGGHPLQDASRLSRRPWSARPRRR